MTENSPVVLILLAALIVNLRMAMYSAALVPHLGTAPLWQRVVGSYLLFDQNYAMAMLSFEENPDDSTGRKMAYFVGLAAPVAPSWVAGTWFGAVAGSRIPPEFALDFALPITFLAMIGPMLRTRAHIVAAVVSVVKNGLPVPAASTSTRPFSPALCDAVSFTRSSSTA